MIKNSFGRYSRFGVSREQRRRTKRVLGVVISELLSGASMRSDVRTTGDETDEQTANYGRGSIMKEGPGDACNSI